MKVISLRPAGAELGGKKRSCQKILGHLADWTEMSPETPAAFMDSRQFSFGGRHCICFNLRSLKF